MRPIEITARLAADVESLCMKLLPGGKRTGSEWKCADLTGKPGDSLGVKLVGPKAGLWSDFATGEKGDMLGLIKAVKGIEFQEALAWAKSYLGIHDEQMQPMVRVSKPKPLPKPAVTDMDPRLVKWFKEKRGISEETLKAFKITHEKAVVCFPYYVGDEILHAKYKDLKKPRKESWRSSVDTTPILFGWQAVPDGEREIVLTEGEMDAMAYYECGISALSIPNGAGIGDKLKWIELEWERLERFDTIYLSYDMDQAGQECWPAVVERLGHHRCRVVTLPKKDANECLLAGLDLHKYKADSRYCDPPELRAMESFSEEVKKLFDGDEITTGDKLPWSKTHENFRLRPGEVTLWHGRGGDGKSMALSMVQACLMIDAGKRICVASMELPGPKLLRRMYQQIVGANKPTAKQVDAITAAITDRGWLVNIKGTAKAELLLKLMEYAYRRYGCSHFVVDSLAKCGFAEDDYNGQKHFVDQLTDFATARSAHVHLVCHDRKDSTDDSPPGKNDVKGTGSLTDMVDNVVSIWRNRKKEADPPGHVIEGDVYLHVQKQRNYDWEGRVALWFSTVTHQYLEYPEKQAYDMLKGAQEDGYTEEYVEAGTEGSVGDDQLGLLPGAGGDPRGASGD